MKEYDLSRILWRRTRFKYGSIAVIHKKIVNFFKLMQPTSIFIRYINIKAIQTKGAEVMIDRIIQRIIQAAIESFPINRKKKDEILQHMINKKANEEVKNDVL